MGEFPAHHACQAPMPLSKRWLSYSSHSFSTLLLVGALHDVSNLLTLVRCSQEMLNQRFSFPESTAVHTSLEIMQSIIRHSLDSFFQPPPDQVFSPNEIILEILQTLPKILEPQPPEIHFLAKETFFLAGSPILFQQILLNLLENAAQANHQQGQTCIRITLQRQNHSLALSIHDCGGGCRSLPWKNVFWWLRKSTPSTQHGIGLMFVQRVVRTAFHGTCRFQNTHRGFCVEIIFPALITGASAISSLQ